MQYSDGSTTCKSGNCTDGEVALHAAMHLRFGTRTIQAKVHWGIIESFFRIISKATGSWLQSKFPEWFLLDKIVLKRQKENWEVEIDHEVIAYNRLRPIQGLTTPKLYGKIQYANSRALILSDIGGSSLSTPDGAVLDEQGIEPLLHQALSSLNEYGVCHDGVLLPRRPVRR
ncbi:hypothetical protein FOXG_21222 [Fusarium oxysporum f. sp. lycopersici 4287]|uniref:Uncharacterized protein n=1 Tax=Fusarium oxysporum f. sp. lycopersici (strain 4287 / CBS 123668 / FGSC 9935 / NRRL 34936) TaxID=426428 RepID=A0A0J9VWB1_FUSO4|nr:hypothetical protein FOXG_21222 [Fusarium oxysporum f. sp. lycopersici 4287]KNB14875.1 hypothetical protein FOXG_21222 [Fusarium oxysporum f. sp. lycopersici 4287]